MDAKLQELVQADCDIASVSFSGVKIGPEGAQAIASVLKVCSQTKGAVVAVAAVFYVVVVLLLLLLLLWLHRAISQRDLRRIPLFVLRPTRHSMHSSTPQVCTSLRELNLSHCAIGGRGAIVLAQALTQDTYIKKLALAGNGLVRAVTVQLPFCE